MGAEWARDFMAGRGAKPAAAPWMDSLRSGCIDWAVRVFSLRDGDAAPGFVAGVMAGDWLSQASELSVCDVTAGV